ncbi:MAG: hypothetical protein O3B13_20200, partial [Planctomycetota bacterium]|nr:hypothetical protein [Planctomycetota bacterium]
LNAGAAFSVSATGRAESTGGSVDVDAVGAATVTSLGHVVGGDDGTSVTIDAAGISLGNSGGAGFATVYNTGTGTVSITATGSNNITLDNNALRTDEGLLTIDATGGNVVVLSDAGTELRVAGDVTVTAQAIGVDGAGTALKGGLDIRGGGDPGDGTLTISGTGTGPIGVDVIDDLFSSISVTLANTESSVDIAQNNTGDTATDSIDINGAATSSTINAVVLTNTDPAFSFTLNEADADVIVNDVDLAAASFSVTATDGAITVAAAGGGITATGTSNITLDASTDGSAADDGNVNINDAISTTGGTVTIVADRALVDGNATGDDITAASLSISTQTGVAAFGNPLETNVGSIAAEATISGGIFITEADGLIVTTVGSVSGLHANAGAIAVTTGAGGGASTGLQISQNVTADSGGSGTSTVTLTGTDENERFTLDDSRTVSSNNGKITLTFDDFTIGTTGTSIHTTTAETVEVGTISANTRISLGDTGASAEDNVTRLSDAELNRFGVTTAIAELEIVTANTSTGATAAIDLAASVTLLNARVPELLLNATAGGISNSGAGSSATLTVTTLGLRAAGMGGNIGTSSNRLLVDTGNDTLAAIADSDIFITESDGATVGSVTVDGVTVTGITTTGTGSASIDLRLTNGTLTVNEQIAAAVTTTTNDVRIDVNGAGNDDDIVLASNGNVLAPDQVELRASRDITQALGTLLVTADDLALIAGRNIGTASGAAAIDTNVTTLAASAGNAAAGSIFIREAVAGGGLTVGQVVTGLSGTPTATGAVANTSDGTVDIRTLDGAITVTQVVTAAGTGNVILDAADDGSNSTHDIDIRANITAAAASGGDVHLLADNGITRTTGAGTVGGDTLFLEATAGVGTSGNVIVTSAATLGVSAGGDVFIDEAAAGTDLTVGRVNDLIGATTFDGIATSTDSVTLRLLADGGTLTVADTLSADTIRTSGANITLVADEMTFATGGGQLAVNAGAAIVVLKSFNNEGVDLGAADTAANNILELSAAELAEISATGGSIVIGSDADATNVTATSISLSTDVDITTSSVLLASTGNITSTAAANEVDVNIGTSGAGSLTFQAGGSIGAMGTAFGLEVATVSASAGTTDDLIEIEDIAGNLSIDRVTIGLTNFDDVTASDTITIVASSGNLMTVATNGQISTTGDNDKITLTSSDGSVTLSGSVTSDGGEIEINADTGIALDNADSDVVSFMVAGQNTSGLIDINADVDGDRSGTFTVSNAGASLDTDSGTDADIDITGGDFDVSANATITAGSAVLRIAPSAAKAVTIGAGGANFGVSNTEINFVDEAATIVIGRAGGATNATTITLDGDFDVSGIGGIPNLTLVASQSISNVAGGGAETLTVGETKTLTLDSQTGITGDLGTTTNLFQVDAGFIAARAETSGNVQLVEVDGFTVGTAVEASSAFVGATDADASTPAAGIATATTTGGQDIILETTAGNVVVDQRIAAAKSGDSVVTVRAAGAILDGGGANDNAEDIFAETVLLTAATGVGTGTAGSLDVATGSLSVMNATSGNVEINLLDPNGGSVTVTSVDNQTAGDIVLTSTSSTAASAFTLQSLDTNAGSISVTLNDTTAASLLVNTTGIVADSAAGTTGTGTVTIDTTAAGAPIQISASITSDQGAIDINSGAGFTLDSSVTIGSTGGTITVDTTGATTLMVGGAIQTGDSGAIMLTAPQNISLTSGASVTAVDGGIMLSANQGGLPLGGEFSGIAVNAATITTDGTGAISLIGRGGDTKDDNNGVFISNGGVIESTASGSTAGTITVTGTNGGGALRNRGVLLDGTNTVITSVDGAIQISGTGGNGTDARNQGVVISNAAEVSSTGTDTNAAAITIMGTGGGQVGTSTNDGVLLTSTSIVRAIDGDIAVTGMHGTDAGFGINVESGSVVDTTGDGTISLTGTGIGGSDGILVSSSAVGDAAGTGTISLLTDLLTLTSSTVRGAGSLVIEPLAANVSIGLGGGTGTLNLTDTEIAQLADGFSSITIGRADGQHAIEIDSATFTDPLTIQTPVGGSIRVMDSGATTVGLRGNDDATLTLDGPDATTTLQADIITQGNAILISDSVIVGANVMLDTTDGGNSAAGANITITGTTPSDATVDADAAASNRTLTFTAGTSGDILLTGDVGSTDALQTLTVINARVVTFDGVIVRSGGISITADEVDFTGGTDSVATNNAGAIVLQPLTVAQNINIGRTVDIGTNLFDNFDLTDTDIAALANGFSEITIGREADGTGTVDVDSSSFNDDLTIVGASVSVTELSSSGNRITLTARTGTITDGGDAGTDISSSSLRLNAVTGIGDTGVDASDIDISVTSLAAMTTTGDISISDDAGLDVTTVDGLSGLTITTGGAGDDILIREGNAVGSDNLVISQAISNAGVGNVTLFADGAASQDDNLNINASVTATGGNVLIVSFEDIDFGSAPTVSTTLTGTIEVHAGRVFNFGAALTGGSAAANIFEGGAAGSEYTIQSAGGTITLTATRNIELETVNAGASGTVIITADSNSDGTGSISDALAAETANITALSVALRAGSGIGSGEAPFDADIDLAVTNVAAVTDEGDIHFQNTGALTINTIDGLSGVEITNSGATAELADITIRATSSLTVAASNSILNNDGGNITLAAEGVLATDDLTINAAVTAANGLGNIELLAGDTVSLAAITISAAGAGAVVLSAGSNFNNGTRQDGNSAGDILMASGANVQSEDGNITLQAPNDVQLSIVNANSDSDSTLGDIIVTADFVGPDETGTSTYTSNGVGAITDVLSSEAPNLKGSRATLFAGSGVGSTDDIDTDVAELDVTNTTSNTIDIVEMDDVSVLRLLSTVADDTDASTGSISLIASGTITVASGQSGVSAIDGNVTLDADTANSDLIIESAVSTSLLGNVLLHADDAVFFGIAGDVTGSGAGNVTVTANHNATASDGIMSSQVSTATMVEANSITMADSGSDSAVIDGGSGRLILSTAAAANTDTSGGDVRLGRLVTTHDSDTSTSSAVTITTNGGIYDIGDSNGVDIAAATGQIVLRSVDGIGSGTSVDNPLETSGERFDVINFGESVGFLNGSAASNVHIRNSNTSAVTIEQLRTTFDSEVTDAAMRTRDNNIENDLDQKAISFLQDGGGSLTVAAGASTVSSGQTTPTSISGGTIHIKSTDDLTVSGGVTTQDGADGSLIIIGSVTYNAGATLGKGNVILAGQQNATTDVVFNSASTTTAASIVVTAARDIIVVDDTLSATADVQLIADSDASGEGGVWLQGAGKITAGTTVTLQGSDVAHTQVAGDAALSTPSVAVLNVTSLSVLDSVRIDVDSTDAAADQVVAGGAVLIQDSIQSGATIGRSTIEDNTVSGAMVINTVIDGVVRTTSTASIDVHAIDRVQVSTTLGTAGGSITIHDATLLTRPRQNDASASTATLTTNVTTELTTDSGTPNTSLGGDILFERAATIDSTDGEHNNLLLAAGVGAVTFNNNLGALATITDPALGTLTIASAASGVVFGSSDTVTATTGHVTTVVTNGAIDIGSQAVITGGIILNGGGDNDNDLIGAG